jgi:sugar O-acyltransferase (sialic acid O-acetyltransferase NeuD family)
MIHKDKIVIVGAGGHGCIVADIFFQLKMNGHRVNAIGFVDDNKTLVGKIIMGLPVIGTSSNLIDIKHDRLILAVGNNYTRSSIYEKLIKKGEYFTQAFHPRATVSHHSKVGDGTVVCAGSIVDTCSVIGDNVILNTGCTINHHNLIEDHVHIAPGVHLGGNVKIGEGAIIGIGATVMPNCSVGKWSIIGAGAVVTNDVPGGVTAYGCPAKVMNSSNGIKKIR